MHPLSQSSDCMNNEVPRIDKGTRIHQLREPVPVSLQGAFFAQVRHRRAKEAEGRATQIGEADLMRRIDEITSEEPMPDAERLMLYFSRLACCESIEALRFTEALLDRLDGTARHLALMTELELRMRVYEDLTEEPQAIIASGLGGEGELIRVNGVAMQRSFEPWQAYQRDLLHNELAELCSQSGGYVEEELWGQEYFGFRLMLPYNFDIAGMIEDFLNTCNEFGNFLHPDCHVTNMIFLTHEHIQEIVLLRKKQKRGDNLDIDSLLNELLGNPDVADAADEAIQGGTDPTED